MLNEQLAHARVSDHNRRAERVAADLRLLASSQPEKKARRPRWRRHQVWGRVAERAPIQAR